ncbi:MAG: hypothetical protein WHX60_08530 [Armatimonadota bacterium]
MKRLLKRLVLQWLEERALRLPESTRNFLSIRYKVSRELIETVEAEFRKHIIQEIESW